MSIEAVKEAQAYLKNLEKAKKLIVSVGVNSDTSFVYPNGSTVQEVAGRHEFGVGVPRRSFLRVPFIKEEQQIENFTKLQFKKVIDGFDAEKALGLIGIKAENIAKEAFEDNGGGTWPDISEQTKRSKGSSGVLIDTGVLRGSITSVVK